VLTAVSSVGNGQTLIQGTLQGNPSSNFRLEFFASAVADPSGFGQGQTFLGFTQVSTDATGKATFSATVAGTPAGEAVVSATATDSHNNTSSFAKDYQPTANSEPTTTQLVVPSSPVSVGQTVTLVATVSAATAGVPSGSVTFTIDGIAQSPVSVALVNGQDQATLATSSLAVGMHLVTAAYSGDASFGPSTSPQQSVQIVTASPTPTPTPTPTGSGAPGARSDGPRVVSVRRYGIHMMPTTIVLTFDELLDPAAAQDVNNYRITDRGGTRIAIRSAVYDAATQTVTLHPSQRIGIHHSYTLMVRGTGSGGLSDGSRRLLDGLGSGRPGSDYTTALTWRELILPAWYRRKTSAAKPRSAFVRPATRTPRSR